MRLTRFSDYCLRVLIYVALDVEGRPTISDIAERYGISRSHLMKVVRELGRLGYLETLRGKHGGLKLKLPPEEICVGTLVRATESDFALAECFERSDRCPITPVCKLRQALDEALQAFLDALDRYTLADLLRPQRSLLSLLELPAAGAPSTAHTAQAVPHDADER